MRVARPFDDTDDVHILCDFRYTDSVMPRSSLGGIDWRGAACIGFVMHEKVNKTCLCCNHVPYYCFRTPSQQEALWLMHVNHRRWSILNDATTVPCRVSWSVVPIMFIQN